MNKGTLFFLFFIVLFGGGVAGNAFLQDRTESIVLAPRTLELVVIKEQQALPNELSSVSLEV